MVEFKNRRNISLKTSRDRCKKDFRQDGGSSEGSQTEFDRNILKAPEGRRRKRSKDQEKDRTEPKPETRVEVCKNMRCTLNSKS